MYFQARQGFCSMAVGPPECLGWSWWSGCDDGAYAVMLMLIIVHMLMMLMMLMRKKIHDHDQWSWWSTLQSIAAIVWASVNSARIPIWVIVRYRGVASYDEGDNCVNMMMVMMIMNMTMIGIMNMAERPQSPTQTTPWTLPPSRSQSWHIPPSPWSPWSPWPPWSPSPWSPASS